jgi:type IV pilus assembly protein PilE
MNFRTSSRRAAAAGFTLIETMVAMSIAGVLASIAYPSFEAPVQKARRSDALVALMQLQMAEERWRSNSGRYATLAQLGAAATSPGKYYGLQVVSADEDGFVLQASATGAQARDSACRFMKLSVTGANVVYASGASADVANAAAANRRCWSL